MRHTTPSSDNLLLGKGIVRFDRFDENGDSTGYRDMGNVDTFELGTADDKLTKNSSRDASAATYKEVTRKRTVTLNVKGDEFDAANVALALMGDVVDTAQAATAVTGELLTTNAHPGANYIVKSYGTISNVTVSKGVTPLVENTDYTVDLARGLIYLLPTGGTVTEGDTLTTGYTPTAYTGATALARVRGGVKSSIEGRVLFLGDPSTGPKARVEVWKVSITPTGAMGLISEDFASLGLSMTVLEDASNHPDSPLYDYVELG